MFRQKLDTTFLIITPEFLNAEIKLQIEWFQMVSSCSSNYFDWTKRKCVRANALVIPPSFYPTCFEWTISTLNYSMTNLRRMKCSQASKMSEKYAKVDPYNATMMVWHCEKSLPMVLKLEFSLLQSKHLQIF